MCSSVRVVNDKRELCAALLGFEDGESLAIYDGKQDTPRYMLSVEENGNSVFFLRDSDGELQRFSAQLKRNRILSFNSTAVVAFSPGENEMYSTSAELFGCDVSPTV